MLACMEETKRTFMTGSGGMPILAKSQVRILFKIKIFFFISLINFSSLLQIKVAMKQRVTVMDNKNAL